MSKRIIHCQCWEWYGSGDFTEGRYKAKGGQEFIYKVTPESEALSEEELIDIWNAEFDRQGLHYRYEAKCINYYWEPESMMFVDGKFTADITR